MGGLTEKQLQEIKNCTGFCDTCVIKELRGNKTCFDFIVLELIMAKTELNNAKEIIRDLEN